MRIEQTANGALVNSNKVNPDLSNLSKKVGGLADTISKQTENANPHTYSVFSGKNPLSGLMNPKE